MTADELRRELSSFMGSLDCGVLIDKYGDGHGKNVLYTPGVDYLCEQEHAW